MKTTLSLSTFSLLVAAVATGCGNADAPETAPAPARVAVAPGLLSVERVLADVDTGRDPADARGKLEALLADGSLSKDQRAPVDLALARLLETTDRERAIALLEDAAALDDRSAETRLFALLAGHEPPIWDHSLNAAPVANSARALAHYFPAATPDKKVEIDIVTFGNQNERSTEELGTFAVAEALRETAAEACGLCDEVKTNMHTHRSGERNWSAIARYEKRLEKAIVVVYVTEDTMMPERYAKWLAAPIDDVRAAIARGQGLVAVKERDGAPPLVTLVAPRAAQFATVEASLAAMTELPKTPVAVKLPFKLTVPEVRSGVRARFGAFKACYTALLTRRPAASGKIDAAYTIGATGKLSDVVFSLEGTLEEPEFRRCVDNVMANVRYPAWSKAPSEKITVRYPIVLAP